MVVPYTLHRQHRIIAGVNKMIRRITHRHGVELLTSVANDNKIDEKNEHTLWIDVIKREMKNLKVSFDVP